MRTKPLIQKKMFRLNSKRESERTQKNTVKLTEQRATARDKRKKGRISRAGGIYVGSPQKLFPCF